MAYDRSFYEEQSLGSRNSAKQIIPRLLELFPIRSAADLGCGLGTWLAEFRACGVEDIAGYDGDYVPREYLQIPEETFHPADFKAGIAVGRRYDLAMSLEVAEHLPPELAENFVGTLTSFADIVLFSSAFPYQGGTGHVNENFPEYWAILFRKHDYIPLDIIRDEFWNNGLVCPWYRQNMLFFIKRELYVEKYAAFPSAEGRPLARIHHELYMWSCVRPRDCELKPEFFELDKRYYYELLNAWEQGRDLPGNVRSWGPEFNIEYSKMSFWQKLLLRLAYSRYDGGKQ